LAQFTRNSEQIQLVITSYLKLFADHNISM